MKTKAAIVAVLAAALLAVPTTAPAAPSRAALAKSVKKLKRERTNLRRAVRREKASAKKWKARAGDRLTTITGLTGQVGQLQGTISALTTANNQLKGTLPSKVAAVAREDNIEQLFNLVIRPAFVNWPCQGSIAYYGSFYDVSFDRRDPSDGACY